MTDDMISQALRFDPLLEAERITGESYKTDKATSDLGMLLHMAHTKEKEALLAESNDSYYNMDLVDQMSLFLDLGFHVVFSEPFTYEGRQEIFLILWHPDGLLATCESYMGTGRNSAKVYYNYRHTSEEHMRWSLISSGHLFSDDVWVGDHDAREGIRHNLNALRAEGEFLPVWVERPWLWLLNYSETKVEGYDHDAINEAKIAKLPEYVQTAITPEV